VYIETVAFAAHTTIIFDFKHLQQEHSIIELSHQAQQLLTITDPQTQSTFIDYILAKESRDNTMEVHLTSVQRKFMSKSYT
jgi:hypothetical protein